MTPHALVIDDVFYARMLTLVRRLPQVLQNVVGWDAGDLVNEAYLRARARLGADGVELTQDRALGYLAAAMRSALIDEVRAKNSAKRSGPWTRVTLTGCEGIAQQQGGKVDLMDLNSLLTKLAKVDASAAEVAEMIIFMGASHEEIAKALGVTTRTIERKWRFAKAWLGAQMREHNDDDRHVS